MKRINRKDALLKRLRKTETCWLWQSSINWAGYGVFSWFEDGKYHSLSAHKAVYKEFIGEVPKGYELDHLCHTKDKICKGGKTCLHRKCVNPEHLQLVTQAENIRNSRTTTLNWDIVREIRRFREIGYRQVDIVKIFNLPQQTINRIINNERWKEN